MLVCWTSVLDDLCSNPQMSRVRFQEVFWVYCMKSDCVRHRPLNEDLTGQQTYGHRVRRNRADARGSHTNAQVYSYKRTPFLGTWSFSLLCSVDCTRPTLFYLLDFLCSWFTSANSGVLEIGMHPIAHLTNFANYCRMYKWITPCVPSKNC